MLNILSALSTQPVQPNYPPPQKQPITDGDEAFLIGWSPLSQTAFTDGKQGRNFKKGEEEGFHDAARALQRK